MGMHVYSVLSGVRHAFFSCVLHDFTATMISQYVTNTVNIASYLTCISLILQGLSMFTVSDDLVVYGGDKSGLAVCSMAGGDWKWAAPAITGKRRSPVVLSS